MSETTPNLLLPYIAAAQAQKHVVHNEALRALDAMVHLAVLASQTAPPASAQPGDRYIVAAGPTGAWGGQAGRIAAFQDGAWVFYQPRVGWVAWDAGQERLTVFDGSAWRFVSGGAPQAASPTFSPPAGSYGAAQSVSIASATPGAVIRYTTDGSTPTAASPLYTGPIAVASSQTLKAIAQATGYLDSAVASAAYTIAAPPVPLVVFIGESNSGGLGDNAAASAGELAPRSQIKIWHNTANAFQDLDVGTNNLVGHAGLAANATHGFELQLANAVAAGRLAQSEAYLVKCGQGGDVIATWAEGHASGYWATAAARITAAIAAVQAAGKTPVPVVFLSLGINDTIGYSVYGGGSIPPTSDWAGWRTQVEGLIARLRGLLGPATPVVMTRFEAPLTVRPDANAQLDAIDAADADALAISSSGAGAQGDGNHWTYAGLKLVTERLIDGYLALAGNAAAAAPSIAPAAGTYAGAQTVTLTAAAGAAIRYATDGVTDPLDPTDGVAYAGPFSATPPVTIRARAKQTGKPTSAIAEAVYSSPATTWDAAAKGTRVALSNGNLDATGDPAGWSAVRATTGKSSGKWYWELEVLVATEVGGTFVLVDNATTAGGAGMDAVGYAGSVGTRDDGFNWTGSGFTDQTNAGLGALAVGDRIQVALDMDNKKVWFGRNDSWINGGSPAAGTAPDATWTGTPTIHPAVGLFNTGAKVRLKPAAAGQSYSPPSGFTALG